MTNCWELFRYGVKRNHYKNFIGIREFSEQIAAYCFNITFTTDTGYPENNITSLDETYNKGTVFTCWSLTIPVLLLETQRSEQYRIS